jgi:hypothetical protein
LFVPAKNALIGENVPPESSAVILNPGLIDAETVVMVDEPTDVDQVLPCPVPLVVSDIAQWSRWLLYANGKMVDVRAVISAFVAGPGRPPPLYA